MDAFKHILVPVDFEEPSQRALDFAVELATKLNASLTLVHVYEVPIYAYAGLVNTLPNLLPVIEEAAREQLTRSLSAVHSKLPKADAILRMGIPWDTIISAIGETGADLVVMGTHGRRGLSHALLGSVAEKVVRLSAVPVLTVRGSDERPKPQKARRKPGGAQDLLTLSDDTKTPRERLLDDHARLDALFTDLLKRLREDDRDETARVWSEFDKGLSAHMAAEEALILPLFREVDPKEAEIILAEHSIFRAKLAELAVAVDLHFIRAEMADELVESLRAHAAREDALMYRWTDELDPRAHAYLGEHLADFIGGGEGVQDGVQNNDASSVNAR